MTSTMEYKIVEYGCLNEFQRKQAVELFIEGFWHFMTFSKDEDLKRKLFFWNISSLSVQMLCGVCFVEAFSNNQAAIRLYEKNGFVVDKREKLSLMRFLGAGYPIRMKKVL